MNRLIPISLAVAALCALPPGLAQSPQDSSVRDGARMFSTEAAQKATETLRAVQKESGWQTVIETVESLDGGSIRDRAVANMRSLRLHGFYILAAKKEHKIEVEPSDSAIRAFSAEESKRLRDIFVGAFKSKEFDRGLLEAVAEIRKRAVPKSEVRDAAGLFSSEAVDKANRALGELQRASHRQVVIETVDSFEGKSPREFAIAHAKAMRLNGLYVVMAKKEHKFYIEPSPSVEKVFTPGRIDEMNRTITTAFKAKEFDRGLHGAIEEIRKDLGPRPEMASKKPSETPSTAVAIAPTVPAKPRPQEAEAPAKPKAAPPEPARNPAMEPKGASFLPVLIVGGLGLLFLLWLMSKAFGGGRRPQATQQPNWQTPQPGPQPGTGPQQRPVAPQAGYGPPPGYAPAPGYGPPPAGYPAGGYAPPPQRGGGFMSGFLGGAAGAVAGNVLYDQFGRPHPSQAGPLPGGSAGSVLPPHHEAPPLPPQEPYPTDAGAEGDWGGDESAPAPQGDDWSGTGGASGDWGGDESQAAADTGGDWGADANTDSGGDVDSGGDAGAGGDWGGGGGSDDDQGQGGGW